MPKKMRLMERIRQQGRSGLMAFLIIFLVSVFAGIGVGAFNFGSCSGELNKIDQLSTGERFLVNEGTFAKHSMLVNGEPVSSSELNEAYLASVQQLSYYMQQSASDPTTVLLAFNQAANSLTYQRVMLQQAAELGLKVTGAEVNAKRDEAVQAMLQGSSSEEGSLLSDFAKKAENVRARNEAFSSYLQQTGLTKEKWELQVRNQLLVDKTREALQAEEDEVARAEALENRAKIDERLAAGESFADLATEFSDEQSAAEGGLIDSWLPRGLFLDPTSEDICFTTPVGEITPWIDLVEDPKGVQRYEVIEEKFLEGDELEAKREQFTTAIREKKGEPEYEPTDKELGEYSRQIKVRQLVLYYTTPNAASDKIKEMVAAADVQVNDFYVLAGQALFDKKLQPPAGFGLDKLKEIAANSPLLAGYDYGLLELKLANGKPQVPETDESAGDPAATDDADSAPAAETAEAVSESDEVEAESVAAEDSPDVAADPMAEAAATEDATAVGADQAPDADAVLAQLEDKYGATKTSATDNEYAPVYPLVIGLLKAGLEAEGDKAGGWPYFMIGKLCLDWLDDEEQLLYQRLDRDAARLQAEESLSRALESLEYDAAAYALRGLNLAWLGKNNENAAQQEEAVTLLAQAVELAPYKSADPVYKTIREAYDVLEDTDGKATLEQKLTEIRLEEAAQQQQQAPPGGQQPLSVDLGDISIPDAPTVPEDAGAGE